MVVFDQENLHKKKQLIIYLAIGLLSWLLGYLYVEIINSDNKWLCYFASQFTISFFLVYNLISLPFRMIYQRNPDILDESLSFETLAAFCIIMGTIFFPFLLDTYIFKYAIS